MDKLCSVCGCDKNVWRYKGLYLLCCKHRHQMDKYGQITERTKYDENKIINIGEYSVIEICNKNGEVVCKGFISNNKVEEIKKYRWCLNGQGYLVSRINGKLVRMHRLLLNAKDGEYCDHINNNRLDNRDENLRFCTRQQNCFNSSIGSKNSSGVIGVSWSKIHQLWVAEMKINGKRVLMKYFKNMEDAIKARKQAEVKYHGEFRCK